MAFDQCHGNRDNLVAVSFSSFAEFYLFTEYYELFHTETRIFTSFVTRKGSEYIFCLPWKLKPYSMSLHSILQWEEGSAGD